MTAASWLFGSFFLGGFECATHRTPEGRRLDLVAAGQHDRMARDDYLLCRRAGIRAVREAARWPNIDRGGRLDLDGVRALARLGRALGMVQIWDLMHYGYPDDLDPFGPGFVERFAAYARAVAEVVREEWPEGPTWYTPVNEISYTAWAAGDMATMAPAARGRGGELKRVLVRAAIAAADAIWSVDPAARLLTVDPLVRQHAPPDRPDLQEAADFFNREIVTEAFDLLAGLREPELGGSRAHLGVVGLNYYGTNQWTVGTPDRLPAFIGWDDPRWQPLAAILPALQARYGGPLVIAETGAWGDDRPAWLAHLVQEAQDARAAGVDLQGLCLYPVITAPDWEDPSSLFNGGLFDVEPRPDGTLERVPVGPMAAVLRQAQAALDPANLPAEPLPDPAPEPPEPPLAPARLPDLAAARADNFFHRTLFAGDRLLVDMLCLEPGTFLRARRRRGIEHVLTVIAGEAQIGVGRRRFTLGRGDTLLVPAGLFVTIDNRGRERLILQQVASPKPWDSRFAGPHPVRFVPTDGTG